MLSFVTYKLLHFSGLAMVLVSLGGLVVHSPQFLSKRTLAITHGIGLLLLLVSGFGMLAKLSIHWPLPAWVGGKFVIWLVLGAYMGLVPRMRARRAALLWWGLIGLTLAAAYLAGTKPV
jgi:hypothetical protein